MNYNMNRVTLQLNSGYKGRDLTKFWNLIHRIKSSHEDITISNRKSCKSLKNFFRDIFKQSNIKSDVILNSELELQTKLDNLHNVEFILELYIFLIHLVIMSLAIYSLGLSLVEALIWLQLWLMMCFLIVQNVDHLFIHVRWTLRVLLTQF